MAIRRYAIALGTILALTPLGAQVRNRGQAFQQTMDEPPVPPDPLELVTGNAQPVEDVSHRAEIIDLLTNARRHSNVRAQPYDLKTTFTAMRSAASDGIWQLEDMSRGGSYRWTAQGPNYSIVNLYSNRILFSSQTQLSLPLRLTQVREAIFFAGPMLGPRASLRTATGNLNGVALACSLISHGPRSTPGNGGRRWDEAEYCVDPNAGTLITYSPAPGLYVLYDYSSGLRFHDKLIANKFTITEAGETIVEAHTESVADPPNNPAALQTAGLNQIGVGPMMTGAWRYRIAMPASVSATGGAAPMVVLQAMQSPDGRLSEVEVLASSDASLNSAALAYASKWQGGMMGAPEPGATPQSHAVLMTLENFHSGQ